MSNLAPALSTKQAIDLIQDQKPRGKYKAHFFTSYELVKANIEYGFEIDNPAWRHEACLANVTVYDPVTDEHRLTQIFLAKLHQSWGNNTTWCLGFFIPHAETMILLEYRILNQHLK